MKILWKFLSCFLGILALFGIIVFIAFFGCAYEFTKYYVEKINKIRDKEEEDEESNSAENDEQESQNQSNKVLSDWNKITIALIIMLGIFCQPIYLMIYLLYAIMECLKRFN